jgi:phosphorylcholine metabolism protein LicD
MGGSQKTQEELIFLYREVMSFLKQSDINLILFYGSLLGYYRDGAFIDKDDDVDVLVHKHDFQKLKSFIIENIKSPIHLGTINNEFIQLYYDNIGPFDIYSYRTIGNNIITNCDGKLIFDKDDILPIKKIEYYGHNIFIPANTKNIVKMTYGENWNIPMNKSEYNWINITKVNFIQN